MRKILTHSVSQSAIPVMWKNTSIFQLTYIYTELNDWVNLVTVTGYNIGDNQLFVCPHISWLLFPTVSLVIYVSDLVCTLGICTENSFKKFQSWYSVYHDLTEVFTNFLGTGVLPKSPEYIIKWQTLKMVTNWQHKGRSVYCHIYYLAISIFSLLICFQFHLSIYLNTRLLST